MDKPDAQCWPNSASLYWNLSGIWGLSAYHKPFCWLTHFAVCWIYHQFPPQHCNSCHSYWGHFLSFLHFVSIGRGWIFWIFAQIHIKKFKRIQQKKTGFVPLKGCSRNMFNLGCACRCFEKGRLLQWLGAPQFASLALSQLKRLGRSEVIVGGHESSRDKSGCGYGSIPMY